MRPTCRVSCAKLAAPKMLLPRKKKNKQDNDVRVQPQKAQNSRQENHAN